MATWKEAGVKYYILPDYLYELGRKINPKRWQMNGWQEKSGNSDIWFSCRYFVFTADHDCSHEIKRCFLLGGKAMTNLDSKLKSIDITLSTKVHIIKAMVFPVVTYGCESWTIKKTEHRRIVPFELQCWRRLLRVSWTARRSTQLISLGNQPWIFIGRTDAEAPILWPPDQRTDSPEKTLMLGKIEDRRTSGNRGWDGWMASSTQRTWILANFEN